MRKDDVRRLLRPPSRSFFLFGPRGVGKSTWLRQVLPSAARFDLLDASLSLELSREPHRLEALVGNRGRGTWVILDEIQKIPPLLDEVHRLIERRGWRFVLCGSSARKLRRKGINLLGGRALTRYLDTFSFAELADRFAMDFSIEHGMLPAVQGDRKNAKDLLNSYLNTYIREEIREESIVRKEPPFFRFLAIAGQLNGQMVNGHNIARDAAVPRASVDVYFSILTDTLLGAFLPAYRPKIKVHECAHPKFYWFDPGVARVAAGLLFEPVDRLWKGVALENLILHELRVYNEVRSRHRDIAYYRTPSGSEIDFVIETRKRQAGAPAHVVCVEVKLAERWDRHWERSMRSLAENDGIRVDRMFGVYRGTQSYRFDGVDVLPVREFLVRLHDGKVF